MSRAQKRWMWINLNVFLVCLVGGLVILTIWIGPRSDPPTPQPDEEDAWIMAQYFVEQQLKSPSTADYGNQRATHAVFTLGPSQFRVSGWVDSQNSFGSQIRNRFFCELTRLNDGRWQCDRLIFSEW